MIDRNVEFPNRFQLQKVEGTDDIYDIIPAPGDVIAPGDLFSKGNMLPDEIVSLLGLKMANPQVKDALNVLANVGNVHVWERVRILSDPIYKPVESSTNTSITLEPGDILYYSSGVDVVGLEESDISLAEPESSFSYNGSNFPDVVGKYIRKDGSDSVYYYPTSDQSIAGTTLWIRGCKKISATIDTPAGTYTDYLTSTDKNAYPDQSAEGGQDAYYTLGDAVSGSFYIGSFFAGSNSAVQYMVSDTPFVDESGSVSISNGTKVTFSNSIGDPGTESDAIAKVKELFAGKYVMRTNDPETDSSTMYYTLLTKNEVVYIPDDIGVSVLTAITGSPNSMALSKYQPVTGHAAIPANTTITYLGQLGEPGAKIEVVTYVGTGTYGEGNPCSVTLDFSPKLVFRTAETSGNISGLYGATGTSYSLAVLPADDTYYPTSFPMGQSTSLTKKSLDGKTISWYDTQHATYQLNYLNWHYALVFIG